MAPKKTGGIRKRVGGDVAAAGKRIRKPVGDHAEAASSSSAPPPMKGGIRKRLATSASDVESEHNQGDKPLTRVMKQK